MDKKSHYINGQWQTGEGEIFTSVNPANGEIIWQGHQATATEIQQAVSAARNAFTDWSDCTTPGIIKRIDLLREFAEIVKIHRNEFAAIITQDNGKPLWEAITEATTTATKLMVSERASRERSGNKSTVNETNISRVRHRPHGVIAVLGPFNFPAHLPNGHIIPALLAGNTVVFKPSELTPLVAEYYMQLWEKINLPRGVLNLIQGGKETGSALTKADVDGVFFTGSYAVGKQLHAQFAGHPEKILALEMGGNNPLIVAQVADLDAAVHCTIQSAFITAGQRCTCARRLFVSKDAEGDRFIEKLIEQTAKITIANNLENPEPFMGPVISEQAALHLLEKQKQLQQDGGKSLLIMQHLQKGTGFISPGIIDVSDIKNLADEEIFGPLLQVIRYDNVHQAIDIANNTRFGLSAGIITDSRFLHELFLKKIRAGIVNWNNPITGASAGAPFGGVGCSGNHRPAAFYAADFCAYPMTSIESEKVFR